MSMMCPCCKGTGVIEYGSGMSEAGLLRTQLATTWGVVDRLEVFMESHMQVATEAFTGLAAELEVARSTINAKNDQIQQLERRLAIHDSWNSRTSDNPEHYRAIKEYREESRRYGSGDAEAPAEASAEASAEAPAPKIKTRREFRREMDAYTSGIPPMRTGGQPGHKGRSRNDKPENTIHLMAELCGLCGTAPGKIVEVVRTRGYDLSRGERRSVCTMFVIRVWECAVCGAQNWPDTQIIIPGTSFGPELRGTIQAYHEAHVSEEDMQKLLEDLENARFAVGTISNCISAMANHLDGPPLALPYEEPLVIRVSDALRPCPTPLPPREDDEFEYDEQDVALTRRSTVWTSFVPQPVMVQIVERASIDPWVSTDETTNHIGSDDVFTLVSDTMHTTRIRAACRKNAATLQKAHGWMKNRLAMRDGTTGFEWHKGLLARCVVHIQRKSEDYAMRDGLGSQSHLRHEMMRETYKPYKDVMENVVRMAGGPVRCASHLGITRRVSGLDEYIESSIEMLKDRINMIIESFPQDGFTTTLENAKDNMFSSARVPGMPGQNNGTEGTVRDCVVPDRNRGRFINDRAAYNRSGRLPPPFQNGISPYKATTYMARDPRWTVFSGLPPPEPEGALRDGES